MTRFRTYCAHAGMAQAPTAPSLDAEKLALLRKLKENIERLEHESSPDRMPKTLRARPWTGYPAQLEVMQEVTTPPDALCLSHACIAASDARRWLEEHGEEGFRNSGRQAEQIVEEQLAKAFRQHVVDLILEYAQFDEERRFYCDRAVAIANGSLPEDQDIPFYAACLNGCIEVIPLGYADYQGTNVT